MKCKVISLDSYLKEIKVKHEAVDRLRDDLLKRIKKATVDQKIDLILSSKRP